MELDCRGLKCPQPMLKVAIASRTIAPGTTLKVLADCKTFPDGARQWCEDNHRPLISLVDLNTHYVATIQF